MAFGANICGFFCRLLQHSASPSRVLQSTNDVNQNMQQQGTKLLNMVLTAVW
jgi:hypothetical protein